MTAPPTPSRAGAATPNELLSRVQAHVRTLLGEDDPEFTRDLVASFCASVGTLCERVEAAMAAGNHRAVMAGAHQIKGSAANVGLARIAQDWHAVEEAARRADPSLDRRGTAPSDGYSGPDRRDADLGGRVAESIATARHVAAALSA